MKVERHAAGSFCISVLQTRDAERAGAFYGGLFGWTTTLAAPAAPLRFFLHDGDVVAAVRQVGHGEDVWVPHVSVVDVGRMAGEAVALGATLSERLDVEGLARLATLEDPEGVPVGLWEPAPHEGVGRFEEPGGIWWLEVLVKDVSRMVDFYGGLFGWRPRDASFHPFDRYVVLEREGRQEGGILPIDPEWDVSPRWNTIVAAPDADAAVQTAKRLGGREVFVHTVPTAGRIAVLSDSGDAVFVVRGPVPADEAPPERRG